MKQWGLGPGSREGVRHPDPAHGIWSPGNSWSPSVDSAAPPIVVGGSGCPAEIAQVVQVHRLR